MRIPSEPEYNLEVSDNCGMRPDKLRQEIQIGLDELDRGEVLSYASVEDLKADIIGKASS